MAGEMSSHNGVVMVLDVKLMSLETVCDSLHALSYILSVANIAFQAISLIIALTVTKCYGVMDSVVMIHYSSCPRYSTKVSTDIRSVV